MPTLRNRETAARYYERNKDHHREVCCYNNMLHRCYNGKHKQFKNYGGRGIYVDARWLGRDGQKNFMQDMGKRPEKHTIERIDNDGPYSPENCRWATPAEQQMNRRISIFVEYEGREMTVREASELSGIHLRTIYDRIRRGEPFFRPRYGAFNKKINTKEISN